MGCSRNGKCRKNQRSKLKGIRTQGVISPASAATGSRAYRRHRTDRQYPHLASHAQHHRPDPQSRKTREYEAPLPPLPLPPPCCAAGTLSSSAHGVHPLPAPLRSQQQPWLGLAEGIRKRHWGGRGWRRRPLFGVPFAASPTSPPRSARSSGDGGERNCCCCLLESSSGVARDDDPLRPPISSSSSEMSTSWTSLLLLSEPLPFAKRDMARTAPIALRQRARGSKFSHRP